MRRQVGRVAVAVAVVGAVVSGCGAGPSQAGSAAIIGNDAIPLEQIQTRLDVALTRTEAVAQLASRGLGPPDIARDIVTRAVLHDLLGRAAPAAGVVVTDAEVDAEIAANGGADAAVAGSLYDLPALRERVRDELVSARLAERSVDRVSVTADILAVTSREEADEAARIIAAGGPAADALFARNVQTSRRGVVYRAGTNPQVASSVLFGTPAGRTVVFQPSPDQAGWLVFRVTDRRDDAPVEGPPVASLVSRSDLGTMGERLVQPLAEDLGVRVNPRYGEWDPIQLRVVPSGQSTGSFVPTAG